MPKKKKKLVKEAESAEPIEISEPPEVPEPEDEIDPVQEWKDLLRAVYDDRPVYVGREYNALHKWYSRLEAITR